MLSALATTVYDEFRGAELTWLALSLGVAAVLSAKPLKLLRPGGAIAAWILGVLVAHVHGRSGLAALFTTSIVAVLLGKLPGAQRDRPRTLKHVSANGLPVALSALLTIGFPDEYHGRAFFCGCLAYLGADVVATQVGGRYGGTPRSVLTGRVLARGESGGVTLLGLVASVLGAAIPLYVWMSWNPAPRQLLPVEVRLFASAGFAAALLDSVLGAALQYRGRDPTTKTMTELRFIDGRPTERVSGVRWLDDDAVNLVSGLAAGALGVAALRLYLGW